MVELVDFLNSIEDKLVGKPVSIENIKKAEDQLGLKFAKEYIEYISSFGFVMFNGHEFTGIFESGRGNVVDVTIEQRTKNKNISSDMYVVEDTYMDKIIIWQNESGEIYTTKGNSAQVRLCDSIIELLKSFEE